MSADRLLYVVLVLAGIFTVCCGDIAAARQTIVIGSLGFGFDYAERTYDEDGDTALVVDQDQGDRREYSAWPEIELQSKGIHDTLSFRYAPVLRYDDLLYTTDVDHYLTLRGERFLTKNWSITIGDLYVLSSDPTRYGTPFTSAGMAGDDATEVQAEPAPDEITQNLGRRRYWTNDLLLETTYTYAKNSDVGFGYTYRVLRNESDDDQLVADYDEYDRHGFDGRWSCMFNPSWTSNLELQYIKGLYEDRDADDQLGGDTADGSDLSQDLEEYWADIGLDYIRSVKDTFPLMYRYRGTQYEDFRPDMHVHEVTAGWEHSFDRQNHLIIGAGPSYVDSEGLDGEWGYNAYMSLTKIYQHGNVAALINKRYDPRNFTGSDDTGLTDITDVRIDATYQFTRDFSSSIFGLYRYEDIIDPQGDYYLASLGDRDPLDEQNVDDVTYTRESFSAGASLEYTFLRWFVASLRYTYFVQDGDLVRDSYDDHRITFRISAGKELWRK